MTADERRTEVASILAAGLLRRVRTSSEPVMQPNAEIRPSGYVARDPGAQDA
jgi:hypothetical protein